MNNTAHRDERLPQKANAAAYSVATSGLEPAQDPCVADFMAELPANESLEQKIYQLLKKQQEYIAKVNIPGSPENKAAAEFDRKLEDHMYSKFPNDPTLCQIHKLRMELQASGLNDEQRNEIALQISGLKDQWMTDVMGA